MAVQDGHHRADRKLDYDDNNNAVVGQRRRGANAARPHGCAGGSDDRWAAADADKTADDGTGGAELERGGGAVAERGERGCGHGGGLRMLRRRPSCLWTVWIRRSWTLTFCWRRPRMGSTLSLSTYSYFRASSSTPPTCIPPRITHRAPPRREVTLLNRRQVTPFSVACASFRVLWYILGRIVRTFTLTAVELGPTRHVLTYCNVVYSHTHNLYRIRYSFRSHLARVHRNLEACTLPSASVLDTRPGVLDDSGDLFGPAKQSVTKKSEAGHRALRYSDVHVLSPSPHLVLVFPSPPPR